MAEPASISAEQIGEAVRASVEKVLQGRAAFAKTKPTVGRLPNPPHWVGIMYNTPPSEISHKEVEKLAADLTGSIKSVPGLGEAVVVVGPDFVTIGFMPPDAPRDAVVG